MATVTVSAITPRAASGPGALDGFGFDCSCRGGQSASLPTIARQWRRQHVAWHEGRGDLVKVLDDALVGDLYRPLYAEAA